MSKLVKLVGLMLWLSISFSASIVENGFLRDDMGVPISENIQMLFKIYPSISGGSAIWDSGALTVPVRDGIYTVVLGTDINPITEQMIFPTGIYYLEQMVKTEILIPRSLMANTLQSISAARAGSANYSSLAGTANRLVSSSISQFTNDAGYLTANGVLVLLSLIHISEPTRPY